MKQQDGLGQPISDDVLYYVQDDRNLVGNCASWWRPNGQGYCCDLREAGQYLGKNVRTMRESDVPWPVTYVDPLVLHHVRGDVQALRRRDARVSQ